MSTPAIVSLPCGCFFQGRKLIIADDCISHGDKEWSCDNCGETAMDGSDRCITCGCQVEEVACCDACGECFPLDELDGKPTINSRLRRIRASEGQLAMLRRAADKGLEFDRLECRRCYGPGYLAAQ
ncbi:hypothetical protein GR212_15620 [Rhizobium lusitanum]|uniref:Uncharacterized protein n=1 Tax=Rhizobium lusitanum TaxID=293958 RepID=A0A6L9UA77_9HYPH|nr:hypothetical protein [Rhizobium lusitanum]NEI71007.1 hypothetical protein [Rhizobium lusitanum]